MEWNKETIQAILQTSQKVEIVNGKEVYGASAMTGKHENRYLVYRMLQAVYDRQWADEKASDSTKHNNGQGFTSADARKLSKFAKQSKSYQNLTPKQAKFLAPRLMKYAGQIALVAKIKQGQAREKMPVQKATAKEYISHCLAEKEAYWDNEFAKQEAKQEALAFMSGIKDMEAFQ